MSYTQGKTHTGLFHLDYCHHKIKLELQKEQEVWAGCWLQIWVQFSSVLSSHVHSYATVAAKKVRGKDVNVHTHAVLLNIYTSHACKQAYSTYMYAHNRESLLHTVFVGEQ